MSIIRSESRLLHSRRIRSWSNKIGTKMVHFTSREAAFAWQSQEWNVFHTTDGISQVIMSISSYVHDSPDDQSFPKAQMTIYVHGNQCASIMSIFKGTRVHTCKDVSIFAFKVCTRHMACILDARHQRDSVTPHC